GLNCNPNRQSVANYADQLGMFNAAGNLVIGLSNQVLTATSPFEDEGGLSESNGLSGQGPTDFRLRWYALRSNVEKYLGLDKLKTPQHITPAKRHCDGSPLNNTNPQLPPDMDVVRVDGGVLRAPIDWNYDGDTLDNAPGDINFNGKSGNTGEKTA